MPVFYNTNRFHYSTVTLMPVDVFHPVITPGEWSTRLHFMQYVSMDCILHNFDYDLPDLDDKISRLAREIINDCPNLRTFTLHLLTPPDALRQRTLLPRRICIQSYRAGTHRLSRSV